MSKLILSFTYGLILSLISLSAMAAQVTVDFAPGVERYLEGINSLEQEREADFRNNLHSNQGPLNSVFTFNRQRLEGTDWAGQRLISDVADYTVDNLVRRLAEDNLARLGEVAAEGALEIRIERIRIANYSIARISAANTYVEGSVRWLDEQAASHREEQITANLVKYPVLDQAYTGPEYAFAEPDENNRIGPVLSYFVEQSLERLFPGRQADIHGPVLVRFRTDTGGELATVR